MVKSRFIAPAVLMLAVDSAAAATVDLTGKPFMAFGDVQSYSLPTSGLEVLSGPGQIALFTKLGLGANGQLGNSMPDMDDAFDTPQANNIAGFRMSPSNEPGGPAAQGAWDRVGWWDSKLSAIHDKLDLARNSMVFFFANNETGGTGTDDLAAWARLELTRISSGKSLGLFELTNDFDHDGIAPYGTLPGGGGIPMGDVTKFTSKGEAPVLADFVDSGGKVCVDAANIPVDCASPTAVKSYEHNLGGDRAAYALVLPELDELIASLITAGDDLSDFAIHVEYRLGCGPDAAFPTIQQGRRTLCDPSYALNGGDEKVFIGTQARFIPDEEEKVPEPTSILLLAEGLLAAAAVRRAESARRTTAVVRTAPASRRTRGGASGTGDHAGGTR